ncbi:MAG: hypothetical protein JEY79_03575 [Pseudodesulfovibrio sp.]|nr:hypothetical protein [Pseudodesulfovibrio sp.]
MKRDSRLTKVSGRVSTWIDEDDKDQFLIVTADSARLKVDSNRAGADLEEYLGEWVEASGIIRRENGCNHMAVHSFEVIDEASWDDDDEDDDW